MLRLLPLAVLGLFAAGCAGEAAAPSGPPEGWVAAGDDRWFVPGADTAAAFRDLSTLEAMGVARDDSEFVRWAQEEMTDIYRTDPETVDSVFAADFLPTLLSGVPAGADYGAEAQALVNQMKTDIYQRYNASRYDPPDEPLAVPAEFQDVSGQIAVQVYVNEANEPVAIRLNEGTGTGLDQVFMRRVLEAEFTDAWVRPTAGRSAGVEIPSWVHVQSTFGG